MKIIFVDLKWIYYGTAEVNFFVKFIKECFNSARVFRCIFDLKWYSIAIEIEHSTEISYSPWITT